MCGIAGAIGVVDDAVRAALRRADEAMSHRGPDGRGTWSRGPGARPDGVEFAHRRLAIVDLDARSAQPMHDPRTGNVLAFNGEIYDHHELRAELAALGHTFRTTSDTEVVLAAWAQWGEACLARFSGMFAIALYEASSGQVVLARDRLGIKPLYVGLAAASGGHTLWFASEVRSLLATDAFPREIDPTALSTFAWHGFVCGESTIVRGIASLPPGTLARVDPRAPRVDARPYWSWPRPAVKDTTLERFDHELRRAVGQHLMADVPVAVFLSGGVDSSAVANLASRVQPGVRTFNVRFEEAAFDESDSARAVAHALGTDHHEVLLTAESFARRLPDALRSLDQPTFDGINTWFVSRAVRDAGVVVALAGTGGDELFGGYASFRELPRIRRASRALSLVPRGVWSSAARAVGVARASHGVAPQTRWGKLGDALGTRGSLVELYQTAYALFSRDFRAELIDADVARRAPAGLAPERTRALEDAIAGRGDLDAVSLLELTSFLGERLLRDTDAASMAASIEARVPLLDHRVVEAAFALDDAVRFADLGTKRPLRDVGLAGLDRGLFDRPKSGFVLPIERWCRTTLSDEVEAVFADREACRAVGIRGDAALRLWRAFRAGAKGIYWSRVWALYVLARWCHDHGVRA